MAPFVLGFILGPPAELQLRRGLTYSRGDITLLFTDPVSVVFLILSLVILVLPLWQQMKLSRRMASDAHTS